MDCGEQPSHGLPEYNISVEECNCSDHKYLMVPVCNCEYDYDDSQPVPLEDIVPLGVVYSFFFIVGILGNCMVIFVVARYRRMRSVTNVFLASLSTSDLCLILFCIPVQYFKYLTYTWEMGEFLCHSVHYVQLFTMICSVLTLTAISVERYYAIAYPMKAMGWSTLGRAKRIIGIIWSLAFILALPSWFTHTLEINVTQRNKTAIWCLEKFSNAVDGRGGSTWEKCYALYQTVVLFAVPVAVMTFCYVRVGQELSFANKHYSSPSPVSAGSAQRAVASEVICSSEKVTTATNCTMVQQNNETMLRKSTKMSDQNVKQIIHMLVAVVLLFTICWSPYVIDDLLVAFNVLCSQSKTMTMKYMRMAFAIMAYSNSCQNPLVYAFMSKHFSSKFKTLCCRCKKFQKTNGNGKDGQSKGTNLQNYQQKHNDKTLLHPNYGRHSNVESTSSNLRKTSSSSRVCNL